MTALEQKKLDYEASLKTLREKKASDIEAKVEAYKQELINSQTHEDEDRIIAVIDALNKVIEYETVSATPETTTQPTPSYFSRFIK